MTQIDIFKRCAIEVHPQGYSVRSPYNSEFVSEFKNTVPSNARTWDKDSKRWLIDISYAASVAELIERHYGEQVAIPETQGVGNQAPQQLEIAVEYIGVCKDRGDGTQSAFGYYNGGWNVIIPETVLRAFFNDAEGKSGIAATYYEALGVDRKAKPEEIKSGYRRMARQWHPDLCREPDAAEQFQRIDFAYKLLSDPIRKKKYDAGLKFEESLRQQDTRRRYVAAGYRTPLRSGLLLVDARQVLGRLVVEEIHSWNDIVDSMGRVHVASWPRGSDHFQVNWVGSVPEEDDDQIPF